LIITEEIAEDRTVSYPLSEQACLEICSTLGRLSIRARQLVQSLARTLKNFAPISREERE
jgi:hypothetical protein